MKHRYSILVLAVASGCFTAAAGAAETSNHIMVQPADLEWTALPSLPAGVEIATIEGSLAEAAAFTVRLKFPPNYELPAHWHPAVERVTVLQGMFYMGLGDKLDKEKGAPLDLGGIMIIQPETNHFAWTVDGETIVQLNGTGPWGITYVNPDDDPRRK